MPHTPLRIIEKAVYRGPHLFSATPMIRIKVDLGALGEYPSNLIPDLPDRLLALLPGLAGHGCGIRGRGGFERRLREGTWAGHIVQHIALELQ